MESVGSKQPKGRYYPLKGGAERLAAWEAARGIWSSRDPDPIAWHEASKLEWERGLPPLHW